MKRIWTSFCAALALAGSLYLATPAQAQARPGYTLIDVIVISDAVCGPDAVGWSASNFTADGWDLTCYY
ncbi:MAG: hypothetical protein ACJ8GN_04675 [Longimicrobiaceae bacterium]